MALDTPWLGYAAVVCGALLAILSLALPSRTVTRVTFGLGMGLLTLEILFATLSSQAVSLIEAAGWQGLRLLVTCLIPAVWLYFSLVFARGNREEFVVRWRVGLVLSLLAPIGVLVLMRTTLLSGVKYSDEGFWFGLGTGGMWLHGLVLLGYVLTLVNLERTFRSAVGLMRWRIKFIIVGLGLMFVVRIYTSSQKLLYHGWAAPLDYLGAGALLMAVFFVGWSVLRCGLGEADVYPSRTVILGSITFTMTGAYLVLLGLLAKAVEALGWTRTLPLQAFLILGGIGALGLVFMSDRTRQQLESTLSRHFRRPSYDYRSIWQRFTERCASEIEDTSFSGVAASFISEVFQALSVTIWLVDQRARVVRFGGSTILTEEEANAALEAAAISPQAWAALEKRGDLVEYAVGKSTALDGWQALCRARFEEKGGDLLLLPLWSCERLVGVLTLADRVGGRKYSLEDRDLLRALGLEIAATLLNLGMLQERVIAREADALRTMASFFAHDLKNTGSTLTLTLQNLKKHFGNPDFREDALKAISKSVDHVNRIVEGLGSLQSELKLETRQEDLNHVMGQVVQELEPALSQEIELVKGEIPGVPLDAAEFKKVLVNLLLNAADAVAGEGCITVRTRLWERWVELSVQDTGCGMDAGFVRKRLFRPFQTTKRKGLGIGLFQSKMIVEAHGGRIEVESQVGCGTTFRVLMPV